MQKVVEVGAPKVAVDAFTRHNQLGLQPSSIQVGRVFTSAPSEHHESPLISDCHLADPLCVLANILWYIGWVNVWVAVLFLDVAVSAKPYVPGLRPLIMTLRIAKATHLQCQGL